MTKREHINLTTKLAAALLTMQHEVDGKLVPIIGFEESQAMTAEQIIARFQFDHYPVPHAFGGSGHPSNLRPLHKPTHREITAKVDVPRIAKSKRLSVAHEAFRAKMLAPDKGRDADFGARRPKQKIQSRGFPKKVRR